MVGAQGITLVEVAARGGGFRIFDEIIPLVSGVNAVRETVRMAMGETPDLRPKVHRAAILRFFTPERFGRLVMTHGVEAARRLEGIVDVVIEVEPGQDVVPITRDGERPGYLIATGETRAAAVACADQAAQMVQFEIAGVGGRLQPDRVG